MVEKMVAAFPMGTPLSVVEDDHSTAGSPVLRVREVGSIEKIENLQPELQTVLLRQGDGPRQADIEGGETGSDHGIATQRPQAPSGLQYERQRHRNKCRVHRGQGL